ncbi:MAG TPA: hypothetical protein VGE41_04305 [Verrucomicrobiae bacterium]
MRNFLNEFRFAPGPERLAEQPKRLVEVVEKGEICDAYLAAVAETLAGEHGMAVPSWAWSEDRKLHRPWFALPWAGLRAVLLHESPAAFRSRNLFVSANALSRA